MSLTPGLVPHLAALAAHWTGAALLALACAGAVYGLGSVLALRRFLSRPAATLQSPTAVTILRPMHGGEPGLQHNLLSLCDQDYPGPVRIVAGVRDDADPAAEVVREAQRQRPAADLVLVVDPAQHGTNRKLSNLINMSGQATGEVVVISDSDVRLPQDGLRRIVAALQAPGAGLVHCLYRGLPAAGFWSEMASLDIDARFAASVAVGETLGAHPCLGPTMALTADTLARIGGLKILADQLADDYVLGAAVRAQGLAIAAPPMVIDHVFPERSLREMVVHELRWARTIRLVQPAGYAGSVITHFLPLAVLGAALTGFNATADLILAVLLAVRLGQASAQCRLMGSHKARLWLIPLRDVLSLSVFALAFLGDRVEWRGARLKVARDGAMAAS
ncbi:MAG TPA: bacteriohopanetetrol glucosamine biosynthesis glycosyltransferase HpnI [Caulobacteraceae bacterium]|nr:bacteriohopanetetrol glucosamine biosynthesis glycosyltransferase HpnI [Caulobacteraceae bacterium]